MAVVAHASVGSSQVLWGSFILHLLHLQRLLLKLMLGTETISILHLCVQSSDRASQWAHTGTPGMAGALKSPEGAEGTQICPVPPLAGAMQEVTVSL